MTSSPRGAPGVVYNHHLHHHHQIGFQMTSFSSLYVEGGLVYGDGPTAAAAAAAGGVRAAAMYRRAGGGPGTGAGEALHATAAARLHYMAGIKKEPRDLGYDVTGTSVLLLTCLPQIRKYYTLVHYTRLTASFPRDNPPSQRFAQEWVG